MWRTVTVGVLAVSSFTLGCTKQSPVVPESDPLPLALTEAKPYCEEQPPVVMEKHVPVPMPCQLQPVPEPTASVGRKGKGKRTPVSWGTSDLRQGPSSAAAVNAVTVYPYMNGALYQVYVAYGKVTTVRLQQGEAVTGYAWGDKGLLDVQEASAGGEGKQATYYLMPKEAEGKTNVTISTGTHSYLMELHLTQSTYMASVSWDYGQERGGVMVQHPEPAAPSAGAASPVATGILPEKLHFGYTISGEKHPRWQPVRVFDDGSKTYLQFPETLTTGEAPVLFLRSTEGTTQLVNYRVKNNFYIVDRLFDYAELRVGERHPVVVKITRQTL